MNEVIDFLEGLFGKEREALYARHKKEMFDEYNSLAAAIISEMYNITVSLGLPVEDTPEPDSYYANYINEPFPTKRIIYKISQYNNEKYGVVWACYVSERD